ncbi:MAG: type II toxin-antitoxin system RelE/ParE family toxin [Bryobacteraceae bacterium]
MQLGERLSMPQSRPMPSVGPGVAELRVRGADGIYRALYFTAFEAGVLVFHAFHKKTQQTPQQELALAKKRWKEAMNA